MNSLIKRSVVKSLCIGMGSITILPALVCLPQDEPLTFQILLCSLILTILFVPWLVEDNLRNQSKTIAFILLALAIAINPLQAQIQEEPNPKLWGAEFSPVGVGAFGIMQGKFTYTLDPNAQLKTELGLGYLIQPQSNAKASEAFNKDGSYSACMASAAIRQFIWKGLHLEEVINFGRGSISNSKVDGNNYNAFVVFTQTFAGYKFNFLNRQRFSLFVIGQGGFGYVPINTNQWPRVEENTASIYPLGDLKVGINF